MKRSKMLEDLWDIMEENCMICSSDDHETILEFIEKAGMLPPFREWESEDDV